MSSPSAPAAPDYTPIANASKEQSEWMRQISQDQLDWAKQQYADNKPFSDRARQSMLDTLDYTTDIAKKDRARYEDLYQPVEDKQVSNAMSWDSPERKARMASQVAARVGAGYDAADAEATRSLESFGIDPSATRYGALNRGSKLARAAAQTGAQNLSDTNIDKEAVALRGDVINTGKGYPAQVNQSLGTGTNAGTAGVNAGNSTTAGAAGSLGNPLGWAGGSTTALANWGNVLNAGYQNQVGAYTANQQASSGWAGAAGTALGTGVGLATMFMADGGSVDEAVDLSGAGPVTPKGKYIDPAMSPSNGAVADDVPAELPNGGKARLNAHEWVMPDYATRFYGTKYLQGLADKAAVALGMEPEEAKPKVGKVPPTRPTQNSEMAVPMAA